MQINVNSGWETDGMSLVATIICMYFNLLFTYFGLYVDKSYYHTLCCCYEHFLISYPMSQKTLQSCDNPFVILWLKTVDNVSTVIFDTNLTLYCWHPVFVSLKKTAFLLKKSWSFALKLCNYPAWSNTFPAKVRKHQETWVPKSQQKLGNFAKKNWLETLSVNIRTAINIQLIRLSL